MTLNALVFQGCTGEMKSISSGKNDYLSTNLILSSSSEITTPEDTKLSFFSSFYSDPENRIKYKIANPPTLGQILSFDEVSAKIEYAPNPNANGTDSFSIVAVVEDSFSSESHTVSIVITPVNDRPVAKVSSLNVNEDASISGQLPAEDVEKSKLSFAVSQAPKKGSVVINADGSYTYTPAKDASGADAFSFVASDGELTSDPALVNVAIAPLNDLPVAVNGNLNTSENIAANGQLVASDVDGDPLTYSIVTQPLKGTVAVSGAMFTYTPNSGQSGTDAFTFRVSDGKGFSNTATVSISIAPAVIGFAQLSWQRNLESDLKEYRIFYGTSAANLNIEINNIGLTNTPATPTYTINGLKAGTTYYFAVKALDTSGNMSGFSNIVSKTP